MDFSWTDDQLRLREETVEFARDQIDQPLIDSDKASSFDGDSWRLIADRGILGANVPESYGGMGLDTLTTVLMLEGLGYGCRDNGLTYAVNGQIWSVQDPLLEFGSEEQKRDWLPQLVSGEVVGAFGSYASLFSPVISAWGRRRCQSDPPPAHVLHSHL